MVDDDVVLVGSADDDLAPGQEVRLPAQVARDDHELAVALLDEEIGVGDGVDLRLGVGAQASMRDEGRCIPSNDRLIASHGAGLIGLKRQRVVPDLDEIAGPHHALAADPIAVELDAIVAVEVLDDDRVIDALARADEPRMAPGHVALGQPDGVALFAANRDLVTDQRHDRCLAFVVLDDQLEHGGARTFGWAG